MVRGLVVLLLLAVSWILLRACSSGPTLAGRSVDGWMRRFMDGTGYNPVSEFKEALREADTNALPFLLAAITRGPSAMERFEQWWAKRARIWGVATPARRLDRDMHGIIPFRMLVIEAVRGVGTNALPALRYCLRHFSDERVGEPLSIIEQLGPKAQAAVPELVSLLERSHAAVRLRTIQVIEATGATNEFVLKALVRSLTDVPGNALAAARILQGAHYRDEIVVELLLPLVGGKVDSEVWDVAKLLEGYGPRHPGVVQAFVKLLHHPVAGFRAKAAAALGTFGLPAAAAESELRTALNDDYVQVREAALAALKRIRVPPSGN